MAMVVVIAMLVVLMLVMRMVVIIMAMSMTMIVRRMGVAACFRMGMRMGLGMGMRMGLGMGVRMGFRMRLKSLGIGAAFGIERRLDLDHAGAETLHHRLDDVVAADPQTLSHDLGRQMTVAEMPGDPHQMLRIVAADLGQRFGGRDHLDQSAVVEHQRVAAPQRHRVFQIEQKLKAARAGHRHPPPVAVVEIEHDGIGRRLRPAMLALDSGGADHVNSFFV